MATRPYPILTVNEKAARAIRAGHPWVYGVETTGPDRPCENGDLVDVVSQKSRWLGTGQRSLEDSGPSALPKHQRPV